MRKIVLCFFILLGLTVPAAGESVKVPILMYHHFTEESTDSVNECSAMRFREHLVSLCNAGYETVTFGDLLDFVYHGTSLPQKPILLTADDGYRSTMEIALPILRELEMKISSAVIGNMEGRGVSIPHFSLAETEEIDGIEFVSHSWHLHEKNGKENGVLTAKGTLHPEFLRDVQKMRVLAERYPLMRQVFVYPYGTYSKESEAVLSAVGYCVTVTTEYGVAEVVLGQPDSLRCMPRIGVHDGTSATELLSAIEEKLAE